MDSYGTYHALVHRLSRIIQRNDRLTLVVGSGLTAGSVPGTSAMLDLTDRYVEGEHNEDLTAALAAARRSSRTLGETYGRYCHTVNEWLPSPGFDLVVQAAVLNAYPPAIHRPPWREMSWHESREIENDIGNWTIPPGVQALADVLTTYPDAFGRRIFTPNFDPLIEIALRRSGHRAATLSLKTDGSFSSVIEDDAIHVVHLHGYWRRGDPSDLRPLLHDPLQLTKSRPTLQDELAEFMLSTTACAIGYGGWDDIFMRTLAHVARWRNVTVMWGFHASDPEALKRDSASVRERFEDASVLLAYSGINTDVLFPSLLQKLRVPPSDLPDFPAVKNSHAASDPPALNVPTVESAAEQPSDLLGQLDRLLGWRWDNPASDSGVEPGLVYWSVRLRRRSVIHAVQGRIAAALSALGARVILCLDDLGIEHAAERSLELEEYIGRIFADVPGSALPVVESLSQYLSEVEGVIDEPLSDHAWQLPVTPWRVTQYYLARSSPSILEVLNVAKIIDFPIDADRDGQLGAVLHALERLDGNKLLTPVTLWAHFNRLVNSVGPNSVITLGGRDEAALWQMWRKVFGKSVSNLYNPILSNLHQDSGFVRWDSHRQLRDYLNTARELPNWDQSGRLIPWLYTNVVLLRTLLDRGARPPIVADHELADWRVTRDLLATHRRQTIDALTEVIAEFFEPGIMTD